MLREAELPECAFPSWSLGTSGKPKKNTQGVDPWAFLGGEASAIQCHHCQGDSVPPLSALQNYFAGGIITVSMMWITPLEASTSVPMILASFTYATPFLTEIAIDPPWTVLAALAATAASE